MIPRLADLSASQRSALPELKLSMHVYTDDPASRFVLVDGRRVGEGDQLSNGLQLAEIRRDGIVLDFNGTRFLVLRP
jgi:general secretion pathway protein B